LLFRIWRNSLLIPSMSAAHAWVRRRAGKFLWFVNEEFFTPELLRGLAQPGQWMLPPSTPIPRRDGLPRITHLVRTRLPELPGRGLIIKRYEPRNGWQSLKDLVRPSRARRAFICAFALRKAGIATPLPIAVGERRCCRWLQESFLICEEIPNAQTVWERRESSMSKPVLARALGRTLAHLHNSGFSHSDPNFSNFLIRRDNPSELMVIDLDGIRRMDFVSPQAAAHDLYRLVRYMEPEERLWFVAQYCWSRHPRLNAHQFDKLCNRHIKPSESSPGAGEAVHSQEKVC
jgi:tRNA A-37 threonylcarbamoyl transferase component Bud32